MKVSFWNKYKSFDSIHGIAFGSFITSIVFILFIAAFNSDVDDIHHQYYIAFFITLSTIFAASLALRASRAQLNHANNLERQRIEHSVNAASAMLPLALSNIASACMHNIRRNFDARNLEFGAVQAEYFQSIDSETMSIIKECIPYSSKNLRQYLLIIIRTYQVLRARDSTISIERLIATNNAAIGIDHNRATDVLNWAALHAQTEHLFAYSRGETSTVSAEWDKNRVGSALRIAHVYFETFPNIGTIYETRRREDRLAMFGN